MGDGSKAEDKEQDTLAAKDRLQDKPIRRGKKGTESGQSGRQVKIKPSKTEGEGEKLNMGSRRETEKEKTALGCRRGMERGKKCQEAGQSEREQKELREEQDRNGRKARRTEKQKV